MKKAILRRVLFLFALLPSSNFARAEQGGEPSKMNMRLPSENGNASEADSVPEANFKTYGLRFAGQVTSLLPLR